MAEARGNQKVTAHMSASRVDGKTHLPTPRLRRLRWVRSGLTLLLVVFPACRNAEDAGGGASSEPHSSKKTVGVSLLTMQHQFYQQLRAGLEESAQSHDYRLLIVASEFDATRQANQIDEFIVQKVDAIVVCPSDSRSVGASIAAANSANIPVFTADIANTSPLGKVVAHIASDNVQGGRKAAQLLVAALGDQGKVAILSHPEVTSVSDRVRGFKEELAGHPQMQVVAELSSEGKRDRAFRVTEDLLQAHADLNGLFAINDDTALGALAAVEAAGKASKVQIVGYDATPEARTKIAARSIYGDVTQNPTLIGRLTVEAIHDHFSGKSPPAIIPVEVGTFTGSTP